jgi:hypothetical protein
MKPSGDSRNSHPNYSIARVLFENGLDGRRLKYPSCLEFAALCGCFYAGMVPIPALAGGDAAFQYTDHPALARCRIPAHESVV